MWYLADRVADAPEGVSVLVPRLIPRHWYQQPLLSQSLGRMRKLVGGNPRIEVLEYPFIAD
jgi:hypothetical protein